MTRPSEKARVVLGLQRFGLGARPGDILRIGTDIQGLFRDEIARRDIPVIAEPPFSSTAELARSLHRFQDEERRAREGRDSGSRQAAFGFQSRLSKMAETTAPPQTAPRGQEPGNPGRIYREDVRQHVLAALKPLGGFGERWVRFWSNHFCISAAKGGPVRAMAGIYEREVIRPHAFGRFVEMLLAAERHPAMLIYLDNQLSLGPNSRAGRNRKRGLNENLAREILELHSLGVAGGYSQADVTALARMLTGWMVVTREGREGEPGTFLFNINAHEPGAQVLLGRTYPEGGQDQAEAALRDIARHPATAQHIARKLARHFVADDPPASLVTRLAQSFRETDGDLQALARTLIDSSESWVPMAQKLRTPQEFVIASLRGLGSQPELGEVIGPLSALGQRYWEPPGPDGYHDTVAEWATAEGIKSRLDVASAMARRAAGRIADPRQRLDEVLGDHASETTRQAVARAESRPQALALMLMSPEFQRR